MNCPADALSPRHGLRWLAACVLLLGAAAGSSLRAAPPPLRLPAEIVFDKAAGAENAVRFSHETHFAYAEGRCLACHPEPFKLVHPTRLVKHEEMNAGRSCGICHDGKTATSTKDEASCGHCHPGLGGGSGRAAPAAAASGGAPTGGPGDIRLARSGSSPAQVVFRHATHAASAGLKCGDCHPSLFTRKAGATRLIKAQMIQGKTCGACHNGKRAFGVEEQCERCHKEGPR